MNIMVTTSVAAGKKRIPLTSIAAFFAVDKYIEVHTIDGSKSFLYGMTDELSDAVPRCCPHCRKTIHTTIPLISERVPGMSPSLRNIERFMDGRETPLLRIHRNCIINTQHVTAITAEGVQYTINTSIGDYQVSRRFHAAINRFMRTKHWFGKRKAVAA